MSCSCNPLRPDHRGLLVLWLWAGHTSLGHWEDAYVRYLWTDSCWRTFCEPMDDGKGRIARLGCPCSQQLSSDGTGDVSIRHAFNGRRAQHHCNALAKTLHMIGVLINPPFGLSNGVKDSALKPKVILRVRLNDTKLVPPATQVEPVNSFGWIAHAPQWRVHPAWSSQSAKAVCVMGST